MQLLIKPMMVENYAIFDVRLRRLTSLMASDGPDETQFFEATWLLGELTMHCYTFEEERGDGDGDGDGYGDGDGDDGNGGRHGMRLESANAAAEDADEDLAPHLKEHQKLVGRVSRTQGDVAPPTQLRLVLHHDGAASPNGQGQRDSFRDRAAAEVCKGARVWLYEKGAGAGVGAGAGADAAGGNDSDGDKEEMAAEAYGWSCYVVQSVSAVDDEAGTREVTASIQ